jgi:lysozyme
LSQKEVKLNKTNLKKTMTHPSVVIALPFIQKWEGFSPKPYLDPVGILTIGYGTTLLSNGMPVKITDRIDKNEALKMLLKKLEFMHDRFAKYTPAFAALNNHQKAACFSLAYNIGDNAFLKSTLLKKVEAGDIDGASQQFLRWNKGGGKVIQGLVNRRADEQKLFNHTHQENNHD